MEIRTFCLECCFRHRIPTINTVEKWLIVRCFPNCSYVPNQKICHCQYVAWNLNWICPRKQFFDWRICRLLYLIPVIIWQEYEILGQDNPIQAKKIKNTANNPHAWAPNVRKLLFSYIRKNHQHFIHRFETFQFSILKCWIDSLAKFE